MKQIRDAQATQSRVGQFDQGLGPVAHQVQHVRTQRLEAFVNQAVPGIIAAIHGYLFHQQIATGQVHEHQHHALQEGFIHRPDDRSYLAMGNARLLPRRGGLQDEPLERVHDVSQGTGGTTHMGT